MNVVFVADYFTMVVTPPIVFTNIENTDLVIDEAAQWFETHYGWDVLNVSHDVYVEE